MSSQCISTMTAPLIIISSLNGIRSEQIKESSGHFLCFFFASSASGCPLDVRSESKHNKFTNKQKLCCDLRHANFVSFSFCSIIIYNNIVCVCVYAICIRVGFNLYSSVLNYRVKANEDTQKTLSLYVRMLVIARATHHLFSAVSKKIHAGVLIVAGLFSLSRPVFISSLN